jgi:ribosomal protein S18 acetylase RimI-like enzyme
MPNIFICEECHLQYFRGVSEEELHHQRYHDEVVNGPQVILGDGYFLINLHSPLSLRQATARAAVLAKRETHYDFPSYTADDDDSDTNAAIAVRQGRIVGLIVTRNQECSCTVELDQYAQAVDEVALDEVTPHRRTAVEMIWVLKAHRGSSIARHLVAKLTKDLSTDADQLAHMTPFTDAALRFWQKLGIIKAYVV